MVESYDPVPPTSDDEDNEDADQSRTREEDDPSPEIFHPFTLARLCNGLSPKLYVINVNAIVGPTVVMSDIAGDPTDTPISDRQYQNTYIFMAVCQEEWASRWEHKIDLAYQDKCEDGAELTEDEDDSTTGAWIRGHPYQLFLNVCYVNEQSAHVA